MAYWPEWKLEQQPDVTVIGINLFGPLQVKNIGGYVRKTFKALGFLIYCLATGAVAIWACDGYDTRALLIALQRTRHHCV